VGHYSVSVRLDLGYPGMAGIKGGHPSLLFSYSIVAELKSYALSIQLAIKIHNFMNTMKLQVKTRSSYGYAKT